MEITTQETQIQLGEKTVQLRKEKEIRFDSYLQIAGEMSSERGTDLIICGSEGRNNRWKLGSNIFQLYIINFSNKL